MRRALNSAFGNLATHARQVDLKAVLGCARLLWCNADAVRISPHLVCCRSLWPRVLLGGRCQWSSSWPPRGVTPSSATSPTKVCRVGGRQHCTVNSFRSSSAYIEQILVFWLGICHDGLFSHCVCPRGELGAVRRDLSELVMEQMELYRYTRESIQAGRGAAAFRDMPLKARDRALAQEMKAENNLHPALCTPDGHYKVRCRPQRALRSNQLKFDTQSAFVPFQSVVCCLIEALVDEPERVQTIMTKTPTLSSEMLL